MSPKQKPDPLQDTVIFDTEPDDAFSLVLGDINASPLLRSSLPLEPSQPPAPSPAPHSATPAHPMAQALKADQGPMPSPIYDAPSPSPTALPLDGPEEEEPEIDPVCTVVADTCALDMAVIHSGDLARTLEMADETSAKIIRLDFRGISGFTTASLAVLLTFARRLRNNGGKRLVLANVNGNLRHLLQTMRVAQTHGITLSVPE